MKCVYVYTEKEASIMTNTIRGILFDVRYMMLHG